MSHANNPSDRKDNRSHVPPEKRPQKSDSAFMEDLYKDIKSFINTRRVATGAPAVGRGVNTTHDKPKNQHFSDRPRRPKFQKRRGQSDFVPIQKVALPLPPIEAEAPKSPLGTQSPAPSRVTYPKRSFSHPQQSRKATPVSQDPRVGRILPKAVGEPRDAHGFLMKSRNPSQKIFPFLTPKQSYEKHIAKPREHHKKRAEKGVLRVIALGGLEQVGINCIAFEYENEVIIVDMGIQFPDEYMFGVQGRVPDISYLKGKKVVAVLITHGHIDHIGGIPYLMRVLGNQIPVYSAPMGIELIKARQEEFKMPLVLKEFKRSEIYTCGKHFHVEPFTVDHSIPDSLGLRIHTPVGKFVHTGDWKFDSDPRANIPSVDHNQLIKFGEEGVRALLSDSTNAHLQGSSMAEKIVIEPIEAIFAKTKGRIITGTFSSIIDRLQIIIETAEKFGRKVVLLGRGMNLYFDIARKLGYIKTQQGTMISIDEAHKLPDNQVCICCTGAQGERYAALTRMATGESKDTEFRPGDTVIFSSSVIPGNERKVQNLMDLLEEQGVIIHHYRQSNVHAGGHAREDDVKLMLSELKPKYFVPIYGSRFMIHSNAHIAKSMGYSDDHVFTPRNGQIMEFTKDTAECTEFFAPHKMITIDGAMIGYTGEKEMIERYQMQTAGAMFITIFEIHGRKPHIEIFSPGFPNKEALPEFYSKLVFEIQDLYMELKKSQSSREDTFKALRKRVQHLIWSTLCKEPMIVITFP